MEYGYFDSSILYLNEFHLIVYVGDMCLLSNSECFTLFRVLETKVAVGGLLVQNGEHVKTSPIVNRLDIHKVVTEDGVEVSLEGTIDQETSTANGFAPGIIQCLSAGKFTVG